MEVKKSVPWTRQDILFPPDALVERSFEDEVYVLTYFPVQEASNFLISGLETNGWTLDTTLLEEETGYIGIFKKGLEVISLMIEPAFDEQGRTRIEIILE